LPLDTRGPRAYAPCEREDRATCKLRRRLAIVQTEDGGHAKCTRRWHAVYCGVAVAFVQPNRAHHARRGAALDDAAALADGAVAGHGRGECTAGMYV